MIKKGFEKKEIRKFAITMSIALSVLGGLLLWRKGEIGLFLCAAALAFLSLSLSYPSVLYPVYRGWMTVAKIFGFFITHLILALIYYLVITPSRLLMRAFNKIPLEIKIKPDSITYWRPKANVDASADRYEKMF